MGAGDIPFRKDMTFEYGVADQVTPLVRRVVARNPGHYTLHGTNSYIVGHRRVAIIDPGPPKEEHVAALVAAVAEETVEHIVVTHTPRDHSPAARPLQEAAGGVISGALPRPIPQGAETTESIHREFAPDTVLADGDVIAGDGWTLEAVHTPGHMSNHMCFALREEGILFTGDHIMGWNTTVVSPPDGNMGEFMDSLERCLARSDRSRAVHPRLSRPAPDARDRNSALHGDRHRHHPGDGRAHVPAYSARHASCRGTVGAGPSRAHGGNRTRRSRRRGHTRGRLPSRLVRNYGWISIGVPRSTSRQISSISLLVTAMQPWVQSSQGWPSWVAVQLFARP